MKMYVLTMLFLVLLPGCMVKVPAGPSEEMAGGALVDQGVALMRTGDLDRAEAAFETAWEVARLTAAIDGLGCVAFLRGDHLTAEKYFLAAIDTDPEYYDSFANLALLYESIGKVSLAKRYYRTAIAGDPENFRARNNYAASIFDNDCEYFARGDALFELLKAESLAKHPLIGENIVKVRER